MASEITKPSKNSIRKQNCTLNYIYNHKYQNHTHTKIAPADLLHKHYIGIYCGLFLFFARIKDNSTLENESL